VKLIPVLAVLSFTALCARPAEAQGAFFDGGNQSNLANCSTGQSYTLINTNTGYFTDGATFPKTGDIVYVRAVAYNVHPCLNDTVGFEFFLPDGASPAVSAVNPVLCDLGLTGSPPSENVAPKYGACLQQPEIGTNGGLFYGYSMVARGYYVQFRVPVVFNKKLLGIGGPASHRLTVATSSSGVPSPLVPFQPVTVFYQASFANFATTAVSTSSANLAFDLKSYFEPGTLFIDYGTTASFGSTLPGTTVPNTAASFPVTVSLTGLNASTPYFWRPRFVTSGGSTFTGATQNFTTTGSSVQTLTVMTGGTGTGTVTSNPAGISCAVGATCTANYSSGTAVTLTATPATGSRLAAWGGACSGTGSCMVTMSTAQTVTASFAREMGSLSVTLSGLPSGTSVDLNITGPDGFNVTRNTLTGTGFSFSDVGTGMYTVTAPNTTVSGTQYTAPLQSATVDFGTHPTINVVYSAPASPPTNVVATAIFQSAVEITWVGVKGVTYEVLRTGANGATATVGSSTSGTVTDKTASPNTAYLYRVRAIAPSTSLYSAPDLATTVIFTDPTLTATSTEVKAAHITQLRTAVDAVRALAGLGAGTYTDPTLTVGVTVIQTTHVTDLRSALAAARSLLSLPAVTFATQNITSGLVISAAEINELRGGVR
jgi:hypothetical protein